MIITLGRAFFFKDLFIFWLWWILAALRAFSSCSKWGLLSSLQHAGFSLPVASLVLSMGSRWVCSVAVAPGLSCPTACGIFLE